MHAVVRRRDAADRHGVDEVLVGPIGALRGAQPFGGAGAPAERDHQLLQLVLVHLVEPGPAVSTDESVAGESLLILVRVCPRGRNLLRRDRTLDALPGRDLDEALRYWRGEHAVERGRGAWRRRHRVRRQQRHRGDGRGQYGGQACGAQLSLWALVVVCPVAEPGATCAHPTIDFRRWIAAPSEEPPATRRATPGRRTSSCRRARAGPRARSCRRRTPAPGAAAGSGGSGPRPRL